jgi:hypothetical protein
MYCISIDAPQRNVTKSLYRTATPLFSILNNPTTSVLLQHETRQKLPVPRRKIFFAGSMLHRSAERGGREEVTRGRTRRAAERLAPVARVGLVAVGGESVAEIRPLSELVLKAVPLRLEVAAMVAVFVAIVHVVAVKFLLNMKIKK